jgi:uncharacterized protein
LELFSAYLGKPEAQLSLAVQSWLGPPARRDRDRALYWARKATRSGAKRAGLLLADILLAAGNSEETLEQVYEAYLQTASQGDAIGQRSVGWCHEFGSGVPKDLDKAAYWYTLAAANGDEDSARWIAERCSKGR